MTAKFFAILTNQGAALLANATALGTKLNITQMAVGDGNGTLPTPDAVQTKLVNQKRIAPLNMLSVDASNSNQIIAEQVIPENEGGFWIREIGLYDDNGMLIAVANCPETYKPQLQEGSGRTQTIRMVLIVSSTAAVTLKIDPSVVLATRQYVDNRAIEIKEYADENLRAHTGAANPHAQYLQINNNLQEIASAGAAQQRDARINLGLAGVAYKSETLQINNNLQEIAGAGAYAQEAARDNLGLSDVARKSDIYLKNNNLSEIAVAGAQAQAAARLSLGLGGVAYTSETLMKDNNLKEIAAAGDAAQDAARKNLGLADIAHKSDVFLQNNNLSEIAVAGAQAQLAARNNLGLSEVARKSDVYLKNNNLTEIAVAGSAAQAACRDSLGLGTSSTRNIGTASVSNVPDMGAFAGRYGAVGYQNLPGGLVKMWGTATPDSTGAASVSYPLAFSQRPFSIVFGYRQNKAPDGMQSVIINDLTNSNTGFSCQAYRYDGGGLAISTSSFYWEATGVI